MPLRDTLTRRFDLLYRAAAANLEGFTAEELAQEVPSPFGDLTTRAGLLSLLAFHRTYHVGPLGMSRRLAGLDGAIEGPGEGGDVGSAS